MDCVLALNAGSSSLRFAAFSADGGEPHAALRGSVSGIGDSARLHVAGGGAQAVDETLGAETHERALASVLARLGEWLPGVRLRAAGHRIVHGGERFTEPVLIDDGVRAALGALVPLAPLHQPHGLAGIDALARLEPALPQVACFDTAFHRSQPPVATTFALPRSMTAEGVRRFGFHGLSYEYIARALFERIGERADGRVVVAHLGSGASLCAMRERRSVATTMGFSALDGVPMGTRCGSLDPGVLLYLLGRGWNADRLSALLWRESGLLGVSTISDDVRTLLSSGEPAAREALDIFTYHVAREIGSLAVALEGLDVLVFTAGIGEHAAPIRASVCARLGWLGMALDDAANGRSAEAIAARSSAVGVYVIPTDEEATIARHTIALTAK